MSADPPLGALAPAATVHPDLHVYDVTLRDGIQAPGASLSAADAGDLAAAIDEVGVRYIEAGYPARDDDGERLECVREAVVDADAVGLSGVEPAEVDAVVDAELASISLFAGGSTVHRLDEPIAGLAERVALAVSHAADHGLGIRFAVTDAGRTPPADLWALLDAAERAGADMLGLTDTVGILTPRIVDAAVTAIGDRYDLPVSAHFHDDFGAAAGNAFAAAQAGASQVHTTVDGLGPMAGNTPLAPFATGMAVHHGIRLCSLSALPQLSERVAAAVGVETPPSAPVVGRNVFRYATGNRAERARVEPRTYEGYPPELVGRDRRFDVD